MIPASAEGRGAVGQDPLDSRFVRVQAPFEGAGPQQPRRTPWFARSPTRSAALVLIPLGIAFGPYGLNVLSPAVISSLTPALPVAVAALGVLVGLRLDFRRTGVWRVLVGSTFQTALTIATVAGGIVVASRFVADPSDPPWLLAVLLGLCAAFSFMATADTSEGSVASWARLIDFDNALAIAIGGLLFGFISTGSFGRAAEVTAQMAIIAGAIATGTWLLVSQTASDTEQRVFAVGALLLLGGIAEYLSLSALVAGLAAGACWNMAGGAARERLVGDMRYVQHPLIVLLLLVAGARLRFQSEIAAYFIAYVIGRTVARLLGSAIVRRVVLANAPADRSDLQPLSSGVVAVGFAVNAVLAGGGAAHTEALLTLVALGTIASEMLTLADGQGEGT